LNNFVIGERKNLPSVNSIQKSEYAVADVTMPSFMMLPAQLIVPISAELYSMSNVKNIMNVELLNAYLISESLNASAFVDVVMCSLVDVYENSKMKMVA